MNNNVVKYMYIGIQIIIIFVALLKLVNEKSKSENKLISKAKKNKKIMFNVDKINALIEDLDYEYYVYKINVFSYLFYIVLSFSVSIIGFLITYKFLGLISTSLIVACFSFFIPYIILNVLLTRKKNKITTIFPSYLVNLKNYTKVDNNIVSAMAKAKIGEPLDKYIDLFNISVKNGIPIYESFEGLKKNINIDKISEFLTLIQHASINGGNVSNILDKYSKIQMKINLRNEKEKQSIFSSKVALGILVLINIYVLFGFVLSNEYNFNLITTTITGEIILNMNMCAFASVGYMYYKISKI